MRPTPGDDTRHRSGGVPPRARPDEARAAAAARLAGPSAAADPVRRRVEEVIRRAQLSGEVQPPSGLASARPARTRPAAPDAARARSAASAGRPVHPAGSALRSGRPTRRRQEPDPTPRRARAMANPSAATVGAAALAPRPVAAPEEHRRPRHLKVVEPGTLSAAQRRRRARAVLMATIAAGTFIAFALVYLHVVLAQRQFRIDHLNAEVSKAQTSYQNLRLKVAQLGSPQQIISTAEGRLGMVQPTKVLYLTPSAPAPTGSTIWPTTKSQSAGSP